MNVTLCSISAIWYKYVRTYIFCINKSFVLFQLQVQVTNLLAANRTGGQVRTDFSTFPTPQFARVSIYSISQLSSYHTFHPSAKFVSFIVSVIP